MYHIHISGLFPFNLVLPVFALMIAPENTIGPGFTVKPRAFGATASLHGLLEGRGHRWPAGLPTNEGLQHGLPRLCCLVEPFTLAMCRLCRRLQAKTGRISNLELILPGRLLGKTTSGWAHLLHVVNRTNGSESTTISARSDLVTTVSMKRSLSDCNLLSGA